MSLTNSLNDNIYNAAKKSHQNRNNMPLHQIKKFLRRLLNKSSNTYKKSPQPEYYRDQEEEIEDNLANESLENEIFEEIDCCEEYSAVNAYNNGHLDIVPIFRGQRYIPVHFARTEAGTFFWTSMVGPDCDVNRQGDNHPITSNQLPELQTPTQQCRWAQA